jgi:protoporphyrin/coproporphyrin ferrochelatase
VPLRKRGKYLKQASSFRFLFNSHIQHFKAHIDFVNVGVNFIKLPWASNPQKLRNFGRFKTQAIILYNQIKLRATSSMYNHASHPSFPAPITGLLLANLGTPDAPTTSAVRRYLAQFFADRRVFEFSPLVWWLLSNVIILNTRPRRSAKLYQKIWTEEGSPLLVNSQKQVAALQTYLGNSVKVVLGMRYGKPSISTALAELQASNARRVIVLPLFPQYSATTTASALDAVWSVLTKTRWLPEIHTINQYHDEPRYIAALANQIRAYWQTHGKPERLLFSFHGIPQRYFMAGDPYYCQCQKTARLTAEALSLAKDEWFVAFQSRFGKEEWLRPYTNETLETWGKEGPHKIDVICPGFSADCLETIEEMAEENFEVFMHAGGKQYRYIPALNDDPDHIEMLAALTHRHMAGWQQSEAQVTP